MRRWATACALAVIALAASTTTHAFATPTICSEPQIIGALTPELSTATRSESFPALRVRVEQLIESKPEAAVAVMCTVLPRVERDKGEQSAEMAWWVGSLATPMIAFMDRLAEAVPLLDFARPILERTLGPYSAEVAEIHVAHAWIATRQGRNADAARAWRSALRIREHTPGPRKIELQKVLVGLAQALSTLREFDDAQQALERAQGILAENGETISEAAGAIENTFVNLAWRQEDYAGTRAHAEAQIRIEDAMNSPVAQRVPAYIWLGQSLERLDEYERAEAATRKAVEIAESTSSAPLQRHHLAALTQLAGLLVTRGKPVEGREYAARAIEVGEATRGLEAPVLVRPLEYLADAQAALGELPDSLRTYERAASIAAKYPNDIERPWIVALYRGLARVQLKLGERDQARASLATALQAASNDESLAVERAATLLTLGVLTGSADVASGQTSIAQAIALYRTRLPESHPAILRAISEACALDVQVGSTATASCNDVGQRVDASSQTDPFLRHDVYSIRSAWSARQGNEQQAYELAIQALAAATTLGTPDPLWRADFALARLLRARNQPELAIFLGKQSIGQIEALRSRFSGDDRRLEQGFLQDKVDVYRAIADWLMEQGRLDEGLDVLHRLKAEELYDYVLRDASWQRAEGAVELSPAELALRDRFEALLGANTDAGDEIDRLGRLQEIGKISVEERRALETLLVNQTQQEAARAARIREFLSGAVNSGAAPVERREVQASRLAQEYSGIGKDAALAFYLLTETRVRVLIATRRGQFEYEQPIDGAALRKEIGLFLEAIGRREDVRDRARALYDKIARPVDVEARRAGAKRLVLWLDGSLRYLPFAVLSDGRQYLVDRYEIENYVPGDIAAGSSTASSTALRASNRQLNVRGFGLTRAVAGFDALPAMADELCDVVRGPIEGLEAKGKGCPSAQLGAGALDGAGYADAAFTTARFESLLSSERDFSVLHLGTHFSLRPGNARKSYLVVGDGTHLTLDSIAALDFRGLQLVTLSACQSGLGGARTDDGREIEGLGAIVQRRGAQHVVASLWRVEDRSTALLMREMYRSVAEPKVTAAQALRRAQLRLRAQRDGNAHPYEHPYYWGGFLVTAAKE